MLSGLRRARADLATMNILLPAAERIASADGVAEPGAEHLLLAAIDLDDGIAANALATVGVDRRRLHDAIRTQHATALYGVGVVADERAIDPLIPPPVEQTGPYRSQGSLQDAFRRATALSKAAHVPLSGRHVLLAGLDPQNGVLIRAFAELGVDVDIVRRQAASH